MTEEMQVLLKRQGKYADAEYSDKELEKLVGNPSAGCKVVVKWGGGMLKDVEDDGYCFSLPMCDEDYWMYDFFVHIPSPENPGGIGDIEGQFLHIGDLIKNKLVKTIEFQ